MFGVAHVVGAVQKCREAAGIRAPTIGGRGTVDARSCCKTERIVHATHHARLHSRTLAIIES